MISGDIDLIDSSTESDPDAEIRAWADGKMYIAGYHPEKLMAINNPESSNYTLNTEDVFPAGSAFKLKAALPIDPVITLPQPSPVFDNIFSRNLGKKLYEITDHLGNVRSVVTDEKNVQINSYNDPFNFEPIVESGSNYYPFGMLQPLRNFSADGYRYGFGGQEKDDEIKGTGNSINYKYRMYDPRLGRFFAVDPIDHLYPELTPFQHSSLNPIWNFEIEGLEGRSFQSVKKRKSPLLTNKFNGGGLMGLLGGSRGRYTKFRNLNIHGVNKPEPQEVLTNIDLNTTDERAFRPHDNNIDLDFINRPKEAHVDRTDLLPDEMEGILQMEFDPGVDADGNPGQKTYEIGIVGQDGTERIIDQTTTRGPGEISGEFKLEKGETLYKREIGEGGTGAYSNVSATKKPEDD